MNAPTALRAAHDAAEEARDLYQRSCAARSEIMAIMVDQGATLAEVGAVLGISKQAVSKIVGKVRL